MVKHTIGIKLAVALGLLVIILVGVGWLGLSRMRRINADLNEIFNRRWVKAELAREAISNADSIFRITVNVVFLDHRDRSTVNALLASRTESTARISVIQAELEKTADSGSERELLAKVRETRLPARESLQHLLDLLVQDSRSEAARQETVYVTIPRLNTYHIAWNEFMRFEEQEMARATNRAQGSYEAARRLTSLLILLAIVVAIGIGVLLTRALTAEGAKRDEAKAEIRKLNDGLEKKVAERTEELARLAGIVESSYDAMISETPEGIILSWNAGAERIFGYAPSEAIGRSLSMISPPNRVGEPAEILQRVKEGETVEQFETVWVRKEGKQIQVALTVSPIRNAIGKIMAFSAVARDITARKIADEALIRSEAQYRVIMETATDALVTIGSDGLIRLVNVAAERIFGYARAEMLGQDLTMLMPEYYRKLHKAGFSSYVQTGQKHMNWESVELTGLRKNGSEIPLEVSFGECIANGQRTFTGIMRDMTEHKKLEDRFQKAFNASPEPIVIATILEGTYIDVNESFLRIMGYRREEVIGRTSVEIKFWERAEDRLKLIEILKEQGKVRDLEINFCTKSGAQRTGLQSAEVIEIGGEKCILAVFKDITEQKSMEKQLRQSQKMEAIGQLSGGIAHDFNNLLSVIIGYSEIMEGSLPEGEPLHKKAEQIKKAGQSAASLTRQLLAFSRQQVLEPKILNINTIVVSVEKLLQRIIGEHIDLQTALDPKLGQVKTDQGQMEQVIMNLVVNARDAMPQGGRLTIETANVDLDEDYCRRHVPQLPGPYVLLTVSDTGIGMDAGTQSHIFEPFFTTKGVGKGTGLGLSTVYGVVRQSKGHIWVYSEPGLGTIFKIYVPRTAETVRAVKPIANLVKPFHGTETILLVEDNESVRGLARTLLTDGGYVVLEAECPERAIEIARQHSGPIHLLLTDVIMPGVNGPELARNLAVLRPEMRVLYMSGYTGFTHPEILDSEAPLLSKPFTRETLLRKLHEELAREHVHFA
jgi:two-component system, cell cycle sensor histidine kinase and response regulator CckA